jgi:membrane fusion protein (multidrug efflux system)
MDKKELLGEKMKSKLYMLISFFLIFSLSLHYGCGDGKANKTSSTKDSTATDSTSRVNEDEEKRKEEEKEQELIPVEITRVKKGDIADYILLSSNLETEKMADIYSRVQGIVEKIRLSEGDFVRKGQVLLELEAEEYLLAEERARVNYQKQEADFNRLKAMFDKNLVSKEEYQAAEYATKGLEIEWKQANLNLSYTKITSPLTGVIGDRLIKLGDRIQPTDKLFSVINTEEMIANVYVPEKEFGNIKKGQKVHIVSDHVQNERFQGWVKRLSPVVDPQSGTFKVTIGVRNQENKLTAGMFVNAHIVTDVHKDVVLIPKTAVVYESDLMNVFVVKDSVARRITLDVGFQDHEKVESLAEIIEGDKIIVIGQSGLKDSTAVKVVSERDTHIALKD